jgi:hypothetical protein
MPFSNYKSRRRDAHPRKKKGEKNETGAENQRQKRINRTEGLKDKKTQEHK